MNYKNFDYYGLEASDVEVQRLHDINETNWRRVLVMAVTGEGAIVVVPAQTALRQLSPAMAHSANEFFTLYPRHIAFAEFYKTSVYLARTPNLLTIGMSSFTLSKLQFTQAAGYDITRSGDSGPYWYSSVDAADTFITLFKPTGADADVDETPTTDSTAQGSESGAGADSSELSELGISQLCTEFDRLKASLTHFRNDCALICEYARTVDELANKLAAVRAVPTVARARKPRVGKADTKTPAPSTGNSVLDAL